MILVKNGGGFDLTDRYNGIDYVFPKGEGVVVSEDVARHIFGFGEADKSACLVRLGWMRTNQDFEGAMQKLAAFVFSDPDQPQQEQGLAPLQTETAGEPATDGAGEPAATALNKIVVEDDVPLPSTKKSGRSVKDELIGSVPG